MQLMSPQPAVLDFDLFPQKLLNLSGNEVSTVP